MSHTPDFSRVPPPSLPPPVAPSRPNPEQFHQAQAQHMDQDQNNRNMNKKTPYSKPIPKNFQNSWNDIGSGAPAPPPNMPGAPPGVQLSQEQHHHQQQQQQQQQNFQVPQGPPPPGCISLQELQRQATAAVAFGNVYPVLPGSNLFMAIMNGEMAVKECLRNEFLM